MGIYTEERRIAHLDIENLVNYFLVKFKGHTNGRIADFDMYDDKKLDTEGIIDILSQYRIVTFNGNNYDIPILSLALSGATHDELKDAGNDIIDNRLKPWEFYKKYGVEPPEWLDHIDLYEPAPGVRVGLKKYGGRMHMPTIQDLPIDHNIRVKSHWRARISSYCGNDLDTTQALYNKIRKEIALREAMSDLYGIDLRSKSDAQVAEAVIKKRTAQITGNWPKRDETMMRMGGTGFFYEPPEFIKFESPRLQELFELVKSTKFYIDRETLKVKVPKVIEDFVVEIGESRYQMGNGGLHSNESTRSLVADDEYGLFDRDVTSYYPTLILLCGMFPPAIGRVFIEIYRDILRERVYAKRMAQACKAQGDKAGEEQWKAKADMFKILLNGTFGKLGSPFSVLFAPHLLIQTTITGQLSILMLIEQLESRGFSVMSANTDGVVIKARRDEKAIMDAVCFDWEGQTGLNTEEVEYSAVYSRDVNCYLAFTVPNNRGEIDIKGKNALATPNLRKDPTNYACVKAVIDYLHPERRTPIRDTIMSNDNIKDFVEIRAVSDGGEQGGQYLGKVVRWYMGVNSPGPITNVRNGNKVGGTDGAVACMTLPDVVPADLDRDWYVNEAYAILDDLGVPDLPATITDRTGRALARLPGAKNIHAIDLASGVAACTLRPKSRREGWIEVASVPDGHKFCAKCRRAEEI